MSTELQSFLFFTFLFASPLIYETFAPHTENYPDPCDSKSYLQILKAYSTGKTFAAGFFARSPL